MVARYDGVKLGQFYRRNSLQFGARKAVVALARKLVVVAWRMLLTGEFYRDEVDAMTQRKQTALQRLNRRGPSWKEVARAVRTSFASSGYGRG